MTLVMVLWISVCKDIWLGHVVSVEQGSTWNGFAVKWNRSEILGEFPQGWEREIEIPKKSTNSEIQATNLTIWVEKY